MRELKFEQIVEIFSEIVDLSGISMEENAVLGNDIPVDSKEMLRILSRIESRYRFRFDPKEVLTLKTLGDIFETTRRRANFK